MNGKKVLLVDEERTIIDTYSYLLSKEGYSVVTADNGRKALEEFFQQPFNLVITDFAIKNSNGRTLLEEIKTLFPHFPVVVLTDNQSEIVRRFAFLLGACVLIEKPCVYENLVSYIKILLSESEC